MLREPTASSSLSEAASWLPWSSSWLGSRAAERSGVKGTRPVLRFRILLRYLASWGRDEGRLTFYTRCGKN